MLKNVTFSAEEELIKAARERANRERTTLNNTFREWLAQYAARDVSTAEYEKLMGSLNHVSVGKKCRRKEMNHR